MQFGQTDRLERHLPLTSVVFEILLALAERDQHGYAIRKEVEQRSDGLLALHPGTLYRAISRLTATGFIREIDDRPDPSEDDIRRKYYRITPMGRHVAELEARRLARQVETARAKRILSGNGR